MIITIDGPASAGKGTLASTLAEIYHLAYFDTGMVYRAVGLDMMLNRLDIYQENLAEEVARKLTFEKMMSLSRNPEFRGPQGGKNASVVSAYPSVRAALLKMQQDFALEPKFSDGRPAAGVVYDGRDTGTVVCPDADIKFFITASPEVRARRRWEELQAKGEQASYEEVLANVKKRDYIDSTRAESPLRQAPDAIVLDNSNMTIAEQKEWLMHQVQLIMNNE